MAKYYGYCYDNEGKFTEIIPINEKPIYEKQTFHREEQKEIVTEEKLCELHQSIEDGTHEPVEGAEAPISKYDCPDCVMHKVDYETVQVPYEEDVIVGYEPDIPENCTLQVAPDGVYYPYFDKTLDKWVKTVDWQPPTEPTDPGNPGKSELESLKEQMDAMKRVLDDILFGGAL